MKRLLLLCFLLLSLAFEVRSQNTISASYGIFPSNEITRYNHTGWENALTSLYNPAKPLIMGFGVFTLGFSTDIGKQGWRVGALAVFSQTKGKYMSEYDDFAERQSVHTYFYTGLISVSRSWYNYNTFHLYSSAALGASYQTAKGSVTSATKSRVKLAYQVNAFGMRFGSPFGAFLEVGYGYTGLPISGSHTTSNLHKKESRRHYALRLNYILFANSSLYPLHHHNILYMMRMWEHINWLDALHFVQIR